MGKDRSMAIKHTKAKKEAMKELENNSDIFQEEVLERTFHRTYMTSKQQKYIKLITNFCFYLDFSGLSRNAQSKTIYTVSTSMD